MANRQRSASRLLVLALGVFAALGSAGQPVAQEVVPITSEPAHKIRLDNGKVRLYEVLLPKGKATLFHEHRADSFSVFIRDCEISNEPRGGTPGTLALPAGTVTFASTALGPYSHRIAARTDFHVMALELVGPAAGGAAPAARKANPLFRVVTDSPRGRAYRVRLAPGESTGTYARPGSTAVFAISAGQVSEELQGGARRAWNFESGHFRWIDGPETLFLRNEGAKPVDLVEIDVH